MAPRTARVLVLVVTALLLAGGIGAAALWPRVPGPEQVAREAAATPPGFVYVPGGWFLSGSNDRDADDEVRPARRRFVPSFYIGRTEVSHAEWKRFRPDHVIPQGHERSPVTHVLRAEAAAYCRWAGGRLPTDLEWEKAARGTDGRRYPWGNEWDPSRCNGHRKPGTVTDACVAGVRRGIRPVDSYPQGASPYGALNMAGNAWEWVADNWEGDPARGIIRGGAVGYAERSCRTYHRGLEGTKVT